MYIKENTSARTFRFKRWLYQYKTKSSLEHPAFLEDPEDDEDGDEHQGHEGEHLHDLVLVEVDDTSMRYIKNRTSVKRCEKYG